VTAVYFNESQELPESERARALVATVDHAAGRVPVIANVGDSSTGLALRHARHAVDAGADALALTPPHYYPHSMDEMLTHFRALKEAFPDLPLLIYNIPQTVRVRVELSTAMALADDGTVAGIKDSQNALEWLRQLVIFVRPREVAFSAFAGTRKRSCSRAAASTSAAMTQGATTMGVSQSFQPGEDWIWCYIDEVMMEPEA